jgi:hypothetical protein
MAEIRACKLTKKELEDLTYIGNKIIHAVEEEDWDEERWKGFWEASPMLKRLAEKAERAGCGCQPHGLISPKDCYEDFEDAVKRKDVKVAERKIKNFMFCILSDI